MIERTFIKQSKMELGIRDFIKDGLRSALVSEVHMQKTPLGEKIVVFCAKPGLIVGKKGANIKQITSGLKEKFNLDNPQLEISEVRSPYLSAKIVASMFGNLLNQYGALRLKGIGHKMVRSIMSAGAMGVEIKISGKIRGGRGSVLRFYEGYLKKSGDVAVSEVDFARDFVNLKIGTFGIIVRIMQGDTQLPDKVIFTAHEDELPQNSEVAIEESDEIVDAKKEASSTN